MSERKEKVVFAPVIETNKRPGYSMFTGLWVELEVSIGEDGIITGTSKLPSISDEYKEEVEKQIKALVGGEFDRFFRKQRITDEEERYCFLCLKPLTH